MPPARGLAAFSVLPFCSALWVMYVTATDSVASMGVCAGGTAIGLLLYYLRGGEGAVEGERAG